jgi:uncharacterized protein
MRAGAPPLALGPVDLAVLSEQVAALDGSALFVQGPPGTGKTYTGGRLAAALMRWGLRVGVAATSHKAIANLLREIEAAAGPFAGVKKSSEDNPESRYDSDRIRSEDKTAAIAAGSDDLIAGTAWLWSDAAMREAVDVLFVDEAGQVSLADAIAMSQGARSLVLLGDPQQLAHVSQGTHPRGSGRSVLEHLLGEHNTVPPDRGVLLETTWRMHPAVCEFVSRTMYDGRLHPVGGCEPHRGRAADARRAARGQPPDRSGGSRADRGRARRAARRRALARPARRLARADARRHPRGRALQRAGAVPQGPAA